MEEVQWYIDRKLVHSIHTSSRRAFRACRRRWDWAHRELYSPYVQAEPLEFGVAFHKAMEMFYEPRTWNSPLDVKMSLALVAFKRECDLHLKKYMSLHPDPDVEILNSYKTRIELGLNVLKYYCGVVSPQYDRRWTPIRVEVPFEVAIVSNNGDGLWCKCDQCWTRYGKWYTTAEGQEYFNTTIGAIAPPSYQVWKGLPVTYGGRLDMLAQDEHGRYWITDWKCQSLDSQILTPSGWTKMGMLKIGDNVIGSSGQPITVLGIYPKGEREVYEIIFRDGTVVECDAEHLWKVKSTQFGYTKILEAQEIMNKPSYENYAVQLPDSPIEFDEQDDELLLHPYVLGSLIGDGYFTQNTLGYSSQSGETVDLLKKYANDGTTFSDYRLGGSNSWGILGPWKNKLQELGLWGKYAVEKFIPKEYLFSSVENRILLLQGLCDTDGNTGMYRFTTTSPQLAEDFRELVWSLGGSAMLNHSKTRLHQNGKTINVPQYGINYWLPENIEPNQLERKRVGRKTRSKAMHRGIKEVRATGVMKEMQCIRVDAPDNLYMTNNFVLTHNTTSRILDEDAEALFLQLDDQIASYVWALWKLGISVAGFVYVEIKKAFPQPPEALKRRYKGRAYSCDKTFLTTYEMFLHEVSTNDNDAWQMGLYDDHLNWLKNSEGPKFTQRHQIHKNLKEIENVGNAIYLEARDMINNPSIYPMPGRFSCNWCLFKQPCLGKNMGEDYQYTLDSMFEKHTKHYYEEQEVSTE